MFNEFASMLKKYFGKISPYVKTYGEVGRTNTIFTDGDRTRLRCLAYNNELKINFSEYIALSMFKTNPWLGMDCL